MPHDSNRRPGFEKIADLVRDAGGRIVGRTRLQKLAYILEVAGLGDGFNFEYKHFGPYSSEVANASRTAALLGLLDEIEHEASWGGVYSVFTTERTARVGTPPARLELAKIAAEADPVELELAATAAFLALENKTSEIYDPWEETRRRKEQKSAGGRLDKARSLYRTLLTVKTPESLPKIV